VVWNLVMKARPRMASSTIPMRRVQERLRWRGGRGLGDQLRDRRGDPGLEGTSAAWSSGSSAAASQTLTHTVNMAPLKMPHSVSRMRNGSWGVLGAGCDCTSKRHAPAHLVEGARDEVRAGTEVVGESAERGIRDLGDAAGGGRLVAVLGEAGDRGRDQVGAVCSRALALGSPPRLPGTRR